MGILNERIKERRTALGLTLLQVAEELGVKEATVQRYESGEIKNIKRDTVGKLAEIFHCSPGYLMGWENAPSHDSNANYASTPIHEMPSDNTIAAHRDDAEDWSPEELRLIEEYKQLLLAARKNSKRS